MALLAKSIIFTGTVGDLQQGIMTMSLPPQIHGEIGVNGLKFLRGHVDGDRFHFLAIDRVPYEVGKQYVFGGDVIDEEFVVNECAPISEEGSIRE